MDRFGRSVIILSSMLLVASAVLILGQELAASMALVLAGLATLYLGMLHHKHVKAGVRDNADKVLNYFYLIGGSIMVFLSLTYAFFIQSDTLYLEVTYFLVGFLLIYYALYKLR